MCFNDKATYKYFLLVPSPSAILRHALNVRWGARNQIIVAFKMKVIFCWILSNQPWIWQIILLGIVVDYLQRSLNWFGNGSRTFCRIGIVCKKGLNLAYSGLWVQGVALSLWIFQNVSVTKFKAHLYLTNNQFNCLLKLAKENSTFIKLVRL